MAAGTSEPAEYHTAILEVLERSRQLGFLGPGPVEDHIRHAWGFAEAFAEMVRAQGTGPDSPESFADLGSGGGVPALVLAGRWPATTGVLIESGLRRAEFLDWAVLRLGFAGRVKVDHRRAESAGRDAALRDSFDLVTARSFGSPAATAECGAPLLRTGGTLIVSEPPEATATVARWPEAGLAPLGLVPQRRVVGEFSYEVLLQSGPCPDRFPRRDGVPAKRPLF